MKNLAPFGCLCFAYNYENNQKLFTLHKEGIFLGYEDSIKKALILIRNPHKIIRTSSFKTIDTIFPSSDKRFEVLQDTESDSMLDFSSQTDSSGTSTSFSDSFPAGSSLNRSNQADAPKPSDQKHRRRLHSLQLQASLQLILPILITLIQTQMKNISTLTH